jgi:hypothetical protein
METFWAFFGSVKNILSNEKGKRHDSAKCCISANPQFLYLTVIKIPPLWPLTLNYFERTSPPWSA